MGWSVSVNLDGLNRKFDTLADSAGDLEKPLAILGARLKQKALKRYKAQNFAPLAESTIQKRAQKGMGSLERKLHSDVRKAMGRARKARGPKGLLEKLLTSKAMDDVLSSQTRGVQNRLAVLAEFQRHNDPLGLKEKVEGRKLTLKQQASLAQREARAVMRAVSKPILGGLDKTLVVVVTDGKVTLESATHQKWSKAQNDGATVGHGATLPERKTVELEQDDLTFFEAVLKSHLLLAFEKGLQGPGF